MNFYKHYLGDYSRDTAHLSLMEHGAYRVLLDHYYSLRKPLPPDVKELHRIAKAMTPAERRAVESVAERFFPVNGDGNRHNKRADTEIEEWEARANHSRGVGRKGGNPYWEQQYEHPGFMYAARVDSKRVKVGITGNWKSRKQGLERTYGAVKLSGLYKVQCMGVCEHKVLEHFKDIANGEVLSVPEGEEESLLAFMAGLGEPSIQPTRLERTSPIQKPEPEESKTSPATAGEGRGAAATVPNCPHEKLIALYHEALPTCTKVVEWNEERQRLMRARWREQSQPKGKRPGYATEEAGLGFWRRYFAYVAQSDFLTGRASGRDGQPPFVATLEWLIRPKNFAKVVEGNYHR